MEVQTMLEAITDSWAAVAPAGYESNAHALVQQEITTPDGVRAIAYPALTYYQTAVEAVDDGTTPDGRSGRTRITFACEFRAADYVEAWVLAEDFRKHLAGLPVGHQPSGAAYASDSYDIDLVAASGSKLVPRKVLITEFTS